MSADKSQTGTDDIATLLKRDDVDQVFELDEKAAASVVKVCTLVPIVISQLEEFAPAIKSVQGAIDLLEVVGADSLPGDVSLSSSMFELGRALPEAGRALNGIDHIHNPILDLQKFLTQPNSKTDVLLEKSTSDFHMGEKPKVKILKTLEEHQILGVVLEPDTVDLQDDILTAEVIETAAYDYNIRSRRLKIMHEEEALGRIEVLESYIAPVEMDIDGQIVTKGTWLMRIRINDLELWERFKSGELDGLSIGGFAKSIPVEEEESV